MQAKQSWFKTGVLVTILGLLCFVPPSESLTQKELANYNAALEAYKERRLDDAMRLAKQAVRDLPNLYQPYELLGQLYYLQQDLRKAEDTWKKGLKIAPNNASLQKRLAQLKKEKSVEGNLKRSDTHPFVLRFEQGQVPVGIQSLKQMLRDTYRKVGQTFDYFPDHVIPVILYSEADFNRVKGLSHRVGGLYDGKIRLPLRPGQTTSIRLKKVLWHEYTHAIVHDLAKGKCPTWLNEGIASLIESKVQPIDLSIARAAYRQGAMPTWDQLWQQRYQSKNLLLNYQTAYLMALYLQKRWSYSDLVRLLKRLGEGQSLDAAVKAQYGRDLKVLESEWRNWLRKRI